MGNQKTREPRQQRSIEKRNRIIEAGYQLFCSKGYYNTNTAEIAKLAGVSTGIVYSYFTDKKDIFIVIIEDYIKSITAPLYELFQTVKQPVDLNAVMKDLITMMISTHTMVKSVHEEMESLAHTDEDINNLYTRFENEISGTIIALLEQLEIRPTNVNEKIHIIMNLLISLVHESVYRRQDELNYDIMMEEVIQMVVTMLST